MVKIFKINNYEILYFIIYCHQTTVFLVIFLCGGLRRKIDVMKYIDHCRQLYVGKENFYFI